jgi:hypothetical protein
MSSPADDDASCAEVLVAHPILSRTAPTLRTRFLFPYIDQQFPRERLVYRFGRESVTLARVHLLAREKGKMLSRKKGRFF